MAAEGLDVLVLGRPANVATASGARQLWTAGSRPFGPGAVVVAATGRTHLLQTWDEGVPADLVSHDDLYGLSWNPANVVANVAAIPGLREARRVGTDSLSPGFPALLASLAPGAELVDATPALRRVRATRTDEERACIAEACRLAEAGLDAMVGALRPGVTPAELLAVHAERLAGLGAPTPPTEAVAHVLGTRVVLTPGALVRGYEGAVGRTWPIGEPTPEHREAARRCRAALDAVVAACRPGATGADLLAAWATTGEPLPASPIAFGLGLGMEPPVVTAGVGEGEVLHEGTVLAVTAAVDGHLERDAVVVGGEVLTRAARGGFG